MLFDYLQDTFLTKRECNNVYFNGFDIVDFIIPFLKPMYSFGK